MPTQAEIAAARKWLQKHGELIPAVIHDQIGTEVAINDRGIVPVVSYRDGITGKLPLWPDQGDAATAAASSNPTAEAVEANLDAE